MTYLHFDRVGRFEAVQAKRSVCVLRDKLCPDVPVLVEMVDCEIADPGGEALCMHACMFACVCR